MMFWARVSTVLLCLCLVTSCATTPAPSALPVHYIPYASRQAALAEHPNFRLEGAMIIKMPTAAESVNLSWQQVEGQYLLYLFGPLGLGTVKIQGQAGAVSLTDSQGKVWQASSPEGLMQSLLGWHLPLQTAVFWVRGLPAPGMPDHRHLDQAGRLAELQQAGWTLHYLQYTSVLGLDLPSVIVLEYRKFWIKVIISGWQLNE